MLKAEKSEKCLGQEPSKPSKPGFEGFEGTQVGAFSENYTPPFNSEGVPCGGCPSCGRGEFWRWPKFHRDYQPNGWVCWFCSPPLMGAVPATSVVCPMMATSNPQRKFMLSLAREMRAQGWRVRESWPNTLAYEARWDFVMGEECFFPIRPNIGHAVKDAFDAINRRKPPRAKPPSNVIKIDFTRGDAA